MITFLLLYLWAGLSFIVVDKMNQLEELPFSEGIILLLFGPVIPIIFFLEEILE